MLSMNFTMLNPLLGKCTLIDPVLAAGAAAEPLPLSACISVELNTDSSPGVLLPWLQENQVESLLLSVEYFVIQLT